MSPPLFCYNCGANEDVIQHEENEFRLYQCSRCYAIIKKVSVSLLYDRKYQDSLGAEDKS